MKTFDWIIVGGGIAGISLSEILTREGHSVALIEKKNKLASVTTREFHEWFHTGSLYTLLKDDMRTLKYILGSLDDLLEFYSSFTQMNLQPTESGLKIIEAESGSVYHGVKNTDKGFMDFGEVYFSSVKKDKTKAWKLHKEMTLNLFVPIGSVQFYFVDGRQ